jgi:ABC-type uncharacterized transport system substrate-binding protein
MTCNGSLCNGSLARGSIRWIKIVLLGVATLGVNLQRAHAHPHILIEARTELLFNAQGQVVGVSNVWDFDDAFSAYAIQGYDSKGDGKPTREDLQPFAEINLNSLAEYGYFTRMKVDGLNVSFAHPKNYFDVFANEKLTLSFTLPLAKPLDLHGKTLQLEVYDPTYFAAITFAQREPVKLVGASAGCESFVHRPEPLDPAIASQLAAIPASQRAPPPNLFAVTDKLVNATRVTCK